MNVPPNRTAPINAAARPLSGAGQADATGLQQQRRGEQHGMGAAVLSRAHNAAEGIAASPTTSHAPVPSRPGECCAMAATRKVPAMM